MARFVGLRSSRERAHGTREPIYFVDRCTPFFDVYPILGDVAVRADADIELWTPYTKVKI
jgi:hypothetical protein